MPTLNDKKKKFSFPSSPLMLFWIIVVVAVCTYIVPAGQYQYIETEAGTMVDPESFQYVDQSPVNPFRLFVAIQAGFIDGAEVEINFAFFPVFGDFCKGESKRIPRDSIVSCRFLTHLL